MLAECNVQLVIPNPKTLKTMVDRMKSMIKSEGVLNIEGGYDVGGGTGRLEMIVSSTMSTARSLFNNLRVVHSQSNNESSNSGNGGHNMMNGARNNGRGVGEGGGGRGGGDMNDGDDDEEEDGAFGANDHYFPSMSANQQQQNNANHGDNGEHRNNANDTSNNRDNHENNHNTTSNSNNNNDNSNNNNGQMNPLLAQLHTQRVSVDINQFSKFTNVHITEPKEVVMGMTPNILVFNASISGGYMTYFIGCQQYNYGSI